MSNTTVKERLANNIKILCACGCGGYRDKYDSKGREFKFINGHGMRGSKNYFWKGGVIITWSGYRMIWMPNHPQADSKGYVREHRYVYEQYYKCCLLHWANVHHRNGNKQDNRIENLEGMMHSEHTRRNWKGQKREKWGGRKLNRL